MRQDRGWNDRGNSGPCKKGGGLLCYVKNNLQISEAKFEHLNCSTRDLELHWLSLKIPNLRPIVILNAYRPPQGDYKTACKIINDSITNTNLKPNTEIYLMGDLNIDLLDKGSPATKELLFTAGLNNLDPKILVPTRTSVRIGGVKAT